MPCGHALRARPIVGAWILPLLRRQRTSALFAVGNLDATRHFEWRHGRARRVGGGLRTEHAAQHRLLLPLHLRLNHFLRRQQIEEQVVHGTTVAGPNLPVGNEAILSEVRRDYQVLVRNLPGSRNRIVLLHRQHCVGRADVPLVGIDGGRRQIRSLAFWRTGRDPLGDRLLVRGAQLTRTHEGAVLRIGVPRRHRPVGNLARDRLRPRTRVLVGEQRHRRDVTGPMATRAVREEDRRHVLVERRRGVLRGRLWGDIQSAQRDERRDDEFPHN